MICRSCGNRKVGRLRLCYACSRDADLWRQRQLAKRFSWPNLDDIVLNEIPAYLLTPERHLPRGYLPTIEEVSLWSEEAEQDDEEGRVQDWISTCGRYIPIEHICDYVSYKEDEYFLHKKVIYASPLTEIAVEEWLAYERKRRPVRRAAAAKRRTPSRLVITSMPGGEEQPRHLEEENEAEGQPRRGPKYNYSDPRLQAPSVPDIRTHRLMERVNLRALQELGLTIEPGDLE